MIQDYNHTRNFIVLQGERCQFSHNFIPAKKMEACKFFLQGYCAKGDMCIYLHSEVPCKYYHTGQKCFNADKCKFSHEPLTDSTKPLLEKAILLEETGTFKPENKPSLLGECCHIFNYRHQGFNICFYLKWSLKYLCGIIAWWSVNYYLKKVILYWSNYQFLHELGQWQSYT